MKKIILFLLLALVALCLLLPIWIAVTGTFSANWELKESLRPVLADGEGFARWTALPRSPTLRSLVQVLLDSPNFFPVFWNSGRHRRGNAAGAVPLCGPGRVGAGEAPSAGRKAAGRAV